MANFMSNMWGTQLSTKCQHEVNTQGEYRSRTWRVQTQVQKTSLWSPTATSQRCRQRLRTSERAHVGPSLKQTQSAVLPNVWLRSFPLELENKTASVPTRGTRYLPMGKPTFTKPWPFWHILQLLSIQADVRIKIRISVQDITYAFSFCEWTSVT